MNLTNELVEELLQLPTGNVADNNNSVPHQGVMDSGIKPIDPASRMVGRAVTVRCQPGITWRCTRAFTRPSRRTWWCSTAMATTRPDTLAISWPWSAKCEAV